MKFIFKAILWVVLLILFFPIFIIWGLIKCVID